MKVSLQWVQDYVPVSVEPEVLAASLTQAGIPVEEIQHHGTGIRKVYTGRITEITPHPDADRLVVCKIDCLDPEGHPVVKQIVTGAPNVRVGQIVPVAYHGARLPDKSISKGKLRGVLSEGMLCSLSELGLSKDTMQAEELEGIYILPEDTPIGEDIKKILGLEDTTFLFELTPNRADCFSLLGIAREIAALTNESMTPPTIDLEEISERTDSHWRLQVSDTEGCLRYAGRLLRNVTVAPSPLWLQNRLRAAGVRPINNVVDVTNYVLLEYGQPLHAFDADKIDASTFGVRAGREGEVLTTLDGVDRIITAADIVVADGARPLALAGIMGGLYSSVTSTTQNIFLEAGVFHPVRVRRSARHHALRSESSGRFERGINPHALATALDRAAQLILALSPGASIYKGAITYEREPLPEPVTCTYRPSFINSYLGTDISDTTMQEILERLGFVPSANHPQCVLIPSWRQDVKNEYDIAEEIARMVGYDSIPATLPKVPLTRGTATPMHMLQKKVKHALRRLGMSESITFSFMHKNSLQHLRLPESDSRYQAVPILNPISDEFPYMRTTLVPSLLETARKNRAQKNQNLWIFEVGSVYEPLSLPIDALVPEQHWVAGLITGERTTQAWPNQSVLCDFYDAKGVVENLLYALGYSEMLWVRSEEPYLHPGVSADVFVSGICVGRVGALHPEVAQQYDLESHTYLFEIHLEALTQLGVSSQRFVPISRYPSVERDVAIVAPVALPQEVIQEVLMQAGGPHLVSTTLFDEYRGSHIEEGYRSLAYRLVFQAIDRTLEDGDIDPYITEALQLLAGRGCRLR